MKTSLVLLLDKCMYYYGKEPELINVSVPFLFGNGLKRVMLLVISFSKVSQG